MSIAYASIIKAAVPAILSGVADWWKERQKAKAERREREAQQRLIEMQERADARRAMQEHEVDDLNSDLAEFRRHPDKVPYDATIAKHMGGGQPTTRLELPRPKGVKGT